MPTKAMSSSSLSSPCTSRNLWRKASTSVSSCLLSGLQMQMMLRQQSFMKSQCSARLAYLYSGVVQRKPRKRRAVITASLFQCSSMCIMHFMRQVNSYSARNLRGAFCQWLSAFCSSSTASGTSFCRQYTMQSCVWIEASPELKCLSACSSGCWKQISLSRCSAYRRAFSAFGSSSLCTQRSPMNLQIWESASSLGDFMSRMVLAAYSNWLAASNRFSRRVQLMAFCFITFTTRLSSSSVSVRQSSRRCSRAPLDCAGVTLLEMMRSKSWSVFSGEQCGPSALREGCFSNCAVRVGSICGVILLNRAAFLNNNRNIGVRSKIQLKSTIIAQQISCNRHKNQGGHCWRDGSIAQYNWFLMSYEAKIQQTAVRSGGSQIEIGSEVGQEGEQESGDRNFWFNQTFGSAQPGDKTIQERSSSLIRLRSLEDEVRQFKPKAVLWQKAKLQILRLNKSMALSSVNMQCGDVAVMEEFFEAVGQLLSAEEGKSRQEKMGLSERKKKESEMFEKLVESNKRRYELEQRLIECEQEIERLTDINANLRTRMKVQSAERTGKIVEVKPEAVVAIQSPGSDVSALQNRIEQLTQQISRYKQRCDVLQIEIEGKHKECSEISHQKQQLQTECEVVREELFKKREEEADVERGISEIREEMKAIVEENVSIREELAQRSQCVQMLRSIILTAQMANENYLQQLRVQSEEDQLRRQQNMAALLQRGSLLKANLRSKAQFCIFVRKKADKAGQHSMLHLDTEQLLI